MDASVGTQRAAGFDYDVKANYLTTALQIRNTAVLQVLRRPSYWLFLAIHLGIKYAHASGHLDNGVDSYLYVSWHDLKVIGGITTFFQVFYVNQCFERYNRLYHSTRDMMGLIYDAALDLRMNISSEAPQHMRLALRYLVSGVILYFCELDGVVNQAEWQELMDLSLVSQDEKDYLDKLGPQAKRLTLLHWTSDVACGGYRIATQKVKLPQNLWRGQQERLMHIRSLQQNILDTLSLPIPFVYFHLLCMMTMINLFFMALAMGVSNSIFGTVLYCFASVITIGIMEVSADLTDPFGNDDVDFPVGRWLADWLHHVVLIAEEDAFPKKQNWKEALANQRPLVQVDPGKDMFSSSGFAQASRGSPQLYQELSNFSSDSDDCSTPHSSARNLNVIVASERT